MIPAAANDAFAAAQSRGRVFALRALSAAIAFAAMPAGAVETSILLSPTPSMSAETAYAAALDGTDVVLGSPGENANTGAIYVIDCVSGPCATPARIAPNDITPDAAFGSGVAISGDTLAATAPGPEPGVAYVYVRVSGVWSQQAELTPSGGSSGERFGVSVALSGDRLAVGADRADNRAGVVYVFVRSGANWVQEARLTAADAAIGDALGSSVALDADTLVAGAPIKAAATPGNYANGAVYVFTRGSGGWSQQAKLVPTTVASADLFGFAVAVAGDRAVIGAPYSAGSRGTAYVFDRSGTAWSQQSELSPAGAATGDEFGWSVALGDQRVVVGAPFTGQAGGGACGRSYLFDGAALGESGGSSVSAPALNELTGWSVAASGARWVASAPGHGVGGSEHAGAAYWFDGAVTIFHSGFDVIADCVAPAGA